MKNAIATKEKTSNGHVTHSRSSLAHRFQHEMNKLFDDFGQGFGLFHNEGKDGFAGCEAKIDVKDADHKIIVTAEVPGVELQDLEITATPNYLSISGEKKAEKEEKEKGYYRMEREYGYFRRVIPMPCEIDKDKVDATFKNGVLTISLPKTLSALEQQQKVTVKAG
ncbi:MAG: Hsp20/alpha crystallin family protein [Candidatus Obscuribacterales bacterium]|nr:Hsp20/alpha crystallin family protein [Candidatus Obscuribacterales bacterium]